MIMVLYNLLLAATVALAFWRGGGPERWGAGIIAVGSIATFVAAIPSHSSGFRGVEWGIFSIDVLTLAAFVFLALKANRIWPMWISAFQLVAVCCHAARMIDPGVIPWAYAIILAMWSFPMLGLIMVGTWRHQRRLRQFGIDRSWNRSSHPAAPMPGYLPRS